MANTLIIDDSSQTITNKTIDAANNTITVDSDAVADNAITLAKMAHGTDGNLISCPHYKYLGDWMKETLRVFNEKKWSRELKVLV